MLKLSYLCVKPHCRSIFLPAGLSFIWPELGTAQPQLVISDPGIGIGFDYLYDLYDTDSFRFQQFSLDECGVVH